MRTPGTGRQKRAAEVRTFGTFEHQLVELRDWLIECGVTSVVMEATGVYWKPVWHVLDDGQPFELLLVNPAHIKNVPGRKTDVNDATWIGQLLECGLLRGSFVPPVEIRELREVTRYRRQLTEERARETHRLQKVLEDAHVKLGDPGKRGVVDSFQGAPRRWCRRDLTEQIRLIAQHRKIGDRRATIGDHHRQIRQHTATIMTTTTLFRRQHRRPAVKPSRSARSDNKRAPAWLTTPRPSPVTFSRGRHRLLFTIGVPF